MTVPTLQRCWLLMGYGVPLAPPHFFLRCGFLLGDLALGDCGAGLLFGHGLLLRHLGARSARVALAAPSGLTSRGLARPASLSAPALPAGRGLLPHRALLFFRRRLAAFFLLRLRRPQHRAPAVREPAAAREHLVYVLRVVVVAINLVVVRHLLAGLDRAQRLDEHPALLHDRLAIRIARVIEETRVITVGARIDDGLRIDDEEERVAVVLLLRLIAPISLVVGNALSEILDDALALLDPAGRKHSAAMYVGIAHQDGCRL